MISLFKEIPSIKENQLHEKFKLLSRNFQLIEEKRIVEEWGENFFDKDNKISKEFQTSFHSTFWELYLHQVFKEATFNIDYSQQIPDFIISAPTKFYVEAVVANIKKGGLSENERTVKDTYRGGIPLHLQPDSQKIVEEAIVRYSNSILNKHKKLTLEYQHKSWVEKEIPFTIALSSYDQINYGVEYIYPLMALLYGCYYETTTQSFVSKQDILKPNTTSKINLGLFKQKEFENISAIIFTCTLTFGKLTALVRSQGKYSLTLNEVVTIRHDITANSSPYKIDFVSPNEPETLSDGLIIFHNPKAKNPLPIEVFSKTNALQIYGDDFDKFKYQARTLPILSRINANPLTLNINQIKENYNTHYNSNTLFQTNGD
ncbi:hypothetical protein [Bacillus cereus]|uniref:hypothetical protein n=1 Tax=Bacillus cereus TaxID=1396 RepID=UPI000BF35F22|nr:hypothetical protein [Bacillus cereus]PEY62889.1 hypothetical protein CN356_17775 [Bacillus cereus]PFT27795.1 hypothetical protein COK61_22320 [Bacillus cereus]PFW02682.1 hypothetical protein COL12_29650 [Bacillus cereus]